MSLKSLLPFAAPLLCWLPVASAAPTAAHPAGSPTMNCPGDQVVWVNTRTGIYHLQGERWFGRTRQGKYECEKAANSDGDRETRNGQ